MMVRFENSQAGRRRTGAVTLASNHPFSCCVVQSPVKTRQCAVFADCERQVARIEDRQKVGACQCGRCGADLHGRRVTNETLIM